MATWRIDVVITGITNWLPKGSPTARVLAAVLAICTLSAGVSRAYGQRLSEGDEIEVLFLGDWRPAVVVETDRRGNVLAEFEFAGGQKRQTFKKTDVRMPYETGAMARGRTWSDPSGSFKIRAALLAINDDSVTLRKEDMDEIQVEISKLSTADQRFIQRLQKELGPTASSGPALPETVEFDIPGSLGSFSASFSGGDKRVHWKLIPCPTICASSREVPDFRSKISLIALEPCCR